RSAIPPGGLDANIAKPLAQYILTYSPATSDQSTASSNPLCRCARRGRFGGWRWAADEKANHIDQQCDNRQDQKQERTLWDDAKEIIQGDRTWTGQTNGDPNR